MSFLEDVATGIKSRINSFGQLVTQSVTESRTAHNTLRDGLVWTFPFDAVDPTGADDYFLYLQNSDTEFDLVVTSIQVTSTVAGTLEVQTVTGTAAGGTAVTLEPRNLGSTKLPDGTFQTAVDITGLADAGHLEHIELVANTMVDLDWTNRPIVIPNTFAIALLWTEATGILTGKIDFEQRKVLY